MMMMEKHKIGGFTGVSTRFVASRYDGRTGTVPRLVSRYLAKRIKQQWLVFILLLAINTYKCFMHILQATSLVPQIICHPTKILGQQCDILKYPPKLPGIAASSPFSPLIHTQWLNESYSKKSTKLSRKSPRAYKLSKPSSTRFNKQQMHHRRRSLRMHSSGKSRSCSGIEIR